MNIISCFECAYNGTDSGDYGKTCSHFHGGRGNTCYSWGNPTGLRTLFVSEEFMDQHRPHRISCIGCVYNSEDIDNYGEGCDHSGGPGDECFLWHRPDSTRKHYMGKSSGDDGIECISIW